MVAPPKHLAKTGTSKVRISIVNPNGTDAMTDGFDGAARAAAGPDVEIVTTTTQGAPEAIEGPFDGAMAVPLMLKEMVRQENAGADAHVIACFDDTGLDAARAVLSRPVIGIGEAAMHMAIIAGHSFSIVTTLKRSVPVLEDNVRRYGFAEKCRSVTASDIPVLALHDPESGATDAISAHIESALSLGAEAIILGCAGMSDFAATLQHRYGVPVIEGVSAAVSLAEAACRCGLSTSRAGVWARPTRLRLLEAV